MDDSSHAMTLVLPSSKYELLRAGKLAQFLRTNT
jgi:hypothetical protein